MEEKDNEIVGIVSMECYFPKLYISQSEFEEYNNVSSGKYTIGLGQEEMAYTTDREDITSISLTVLSNLMEKNNISYSDIGWICVATETIIDHSKSISSSLQQLFKKHGNNSIEGIDVKHACYAGTFALFTAFDRITSKYWDGKYCIVIAADIAEYEQGPARCTGGCGAVALLIGKNGCIDLNIIRSSYKSHDHDFFKPNLNSPYPVVNGPLSNECYLNALDSCFNSYKNKYIDKYNRNWRPILHSNAPNYWIFHAPYNKLVSKAFGRCIYHDFLNNPSFYYKKYENDDKMTEFLKKYEKISYNDTVNTRPVIKTFEKISKDFYNSYVSPSTFIPKSIGNCYTASIFMGLISLIFKCSDDLENALMGKTIQMFSYGSGTLASLYSLNVIKSKSALKLLQQIVKNNDIDKRFAKRTKTSCNQYNDIMNKKQMQFHNDDTKMEKDFVPQTMIKKQYFYPNTYYLTKMDQQKQRFYDKFEYKENEIDDELPTNIKLMNEHEINKNIARLKIDDEDELENDDDNKPNKPFNLEQFGQFIGDKMAEKSRKILEKAQKNKGLSKSGAIKIDKMTSSAQSATEIATKCSNS